MQRWGCQIYNPARTDQLGTLKTNFILIDFENVQPKDLVQLQGHSFKIKVFYGAHQTKIPSRSPKNSSDLDQTLPNTSTSRARAAMPSTSTSPIISAGSLPSNRTQPSTSFPRTLGLTRLSSTSRPKTSRAIGWHRSVLSPALSHPSPRHLRI